MDVTSLLQEGECFMEEKKFELAIAQFSNVIILDSTIACPFRQRGYCHFRLGHYEDALKDYNMACHIDPHFWFTFAERAYVYFKLEKYKEAIDNCQKAVELEPRGAFAFFIFSVVCYKIKDFKAALKMISKAIEIDDQAYYFYKRAKIYGRLGKLIEEQIEQLDIAIKKSPNSRCYFLRGVIKQEAGYITPAIEDYDNALRLDVNHFKARYQKAKCLSFIREYEKSAQEFTTLIQLGHNMHWIYYECGLANYDAKRWAEAAADFKQCTILEPTRENYWYRRGCASKEMGNFDDAFSEFTKAIRLNPYVDYAYSEKALLCYKMEKYEQALECINAVLYILPNNIEHLNTRGLILRNMGRYQEAIRDFTVTEKSGASNIHSLANLGLLKYLTGDFAGGIAALECAYQIRFHETDVDIRYCYAKLKQGDLITIQETLRKPEILHSEPLKIAIMQTIFDAFCKPCPISICVAINMIEKHEKLIDYVGILICAILIEKDEKTFESIIQSLLRALSNAFPNTPSVQEFVINRQFPLVERQ